MKKVSTIRVESLKGIRISEYLTNYGSNYYYVENFDPAHSRPFFFLADAINYAKAAASDLVLTAIGVKF